MKTRVVMREPGGRPEWIGAAWLVEVQQRDGTWLTVLGWNDCQTALGCARELSHAVGAALVGYRNNVLAVFEDAAARPPGEDS